nr:MAG TPA: major capsid protein [Caudoviricetes sp.]
MKKWIDEFEEVNNRLDELKGLVKNSQSVEDVDKFTTEYKDLVERKNALEQTKPNKEQKMNYLETQQSLKDFVAIQTNNKLSNEERLTAWNEKLAENGVTVTDPSAYLPKKLELELQTVLTRANAVFPLFRATNAGAILISQELTSNDEAQIHTPGTTKTRQAATLTVSGIKPRMIYKAQSIDEIQKQTLSSFENLYETIVAELAQRVIDKVVDLALVEGTATGAEGASATENGFISVTTETNTNKVKHVSGKDDLIAGIESAVDEITVGGKKYLIITKAHKHAILKALRTKFPQMTVRNNNTDIADALGVDELVIYQGTKAIKPTVMAEGAYAVDMKPLNRIEQFRFDTNENDILVETTASGRPYLFGGIAVIDLD